MGTARKVRALSDALVEIGPTWEELDEYGPDEWERVARLATETIRKDIPEAKAVHPPNRPETLRAVLAAFAGRRGAEPQCPPRRTPA